MVDGVSKADQEAAQIIDVNMASDDPDDVRSARCRASAKVEGHRAAPHVTGSIGGQSTNQLSGTCAITEES